MNEIPVPYLRANQTGIVVVVIIAAITQQPLLIVLLWAIQVAGFLFGGKANLFIRLAKPFLKKYIMNALTESKELSRFNNLLAVAFLTISLLFFALGWTIAGYIVAGMLAIAAFAAICGFCIGCTLYFQYNLYKTRKITDKIDTI